MPRTPPLRLHREAARSAWRYLFLFLGGIVLGVVMIAVGMVAWFLSIGGFVLIGVSLVGIVASLFAIADPTRLGTLRGLGRTKRERLLRLADIDRELTAGPGTYWAYGGVRTWIGRRWVAWVGRRGPEVVRAHDVVWLWSRMEVSGNSLFPSRTYYVCMRTRNDTTLECVVSKRHKDEVLNRFAATFPHAAIGFSDDTRRAPTNELVRLADARAASALPSPTPDSPPAFIPASPPTFAHETARRPKRRPLSTALMAAGVVTAVCATCVASAMLLFGLIEHSESAVLPLSAACGGRGVPSAAAYDASATPSYVTFVQQEDGTWEWSPEIADDGGTESTSVEDTAIVRCLGPELRVAIERCESKHHEAATRFSWQQRARLVRARDGTLVTEQTVSGEPPPSCRDASADRTEIEGGRPKDNAPAWRQLMATLQTTKLAAPNGLILSL